MTDTVDLLVLRFFRNHDRKDIYFSPFCNIITGPNGAGKSNIIEALHYVSALKSYRLSKENEMMKWGSEGFFCSVETGCGNKFETGFSAGQKKMSVNGNITRRFADYYGLFNSIVFSPDDVMLINGSPDTRRRYFDSVISKYDREYLQDIIQLKKVLKQRNIFFRKHIKSKDIDIWDCMCAGLMKRVSEKRLKYSAMLSDYFGRSFVQFSEFNFIPDIAYVSRIKGLDESDIQKLLKETRDESYRRGTGVCGTHRDDYAISDGNNHLLSECASQGQRKLATLSLKYAEYLLADEVFGKKPVLLLDDVFSELDDERSSLISGIMRKTGSQVIITSVNNYFLNEDVNLIELDQNGRLVV